MSIARFYEPFYSFSDVDSLLNEAFRGHRAAFSNANERQQEVSRALKPRLVTISYEANSSHSPQWASEWTCTRTQNPTRSPQRSSSQGSRKITSASTSTTTVSPFPVTSLARLNGTRTATLLENAALASFPGRLAFLRTQR